MDPRLNLAQIIEASVGGKVGLVLDQSASETLILREYELNRLEEALHRFERFQLAK